MAYRSPASDDTKLDKHYRVFCEEAHMKDSDDPAFLSIGRAIKWAIWIFVAGVV